MIPLWGTPGAPELGPCAMAAYRLVLSTVSCAPLNCIAALHYDISFLAQGLVGAMVACPSRATVALLKFNLVLSLLWFPLHLLLVVQSVQCFGRKVCVQCPYPHSLARCFGSPPSFSRPLPFFRSVPSILQPSYARWILLLAAFSCALPVLAPVCGSGLALVALSRRRPWQ